jgi:hypothetical protein
MQPARTSADRYLKDTSVRAVEQYRDAMGTRAQSFRLLAASMMAAVALTGCTGSDSPTPTATTAPTTPAPIDLPQDEAPTPRISADCSDLVSTDTIHEVMSADVTERQLVRRSPEDVMFQQAGMLRCFWANADPRPEWEPPDPALARVLFTVVPEATEMWARVFEVYGPIYGPSPYGPDALGPRCNAPLPPSTTGSCEFEALVGDYWASLSMSGVQAGGDGSEAGFVDSAKRLIDPLLDRLAEEGEAQPPWMPPTDGPQAPLTCASVLTAEQAIEITGEPNLYVDLHMDGPPTSPLVHALEVTGADRCAIGILDSDNEIGDISYLPGGAWAFRELSPSWRSSGATEISLDGAEEGEQFLSQCTVDAEECLVDMLVGDDWLQVRLPPWLPEIFGYPPGVDIQYQRGQITELAEAVLANLHTRT